MNLHLYNNDFELARVGSSTFESETCVLKMHLLHKLILFGMPCTISGFVGFMLYYWFLVRFLLYYLRFC